ncbi:hypothetical protein PybrP1_011343 [[Pythium] brassicae (nom. inval.)]|nr:hypothetical protein PybrP1_011343 [[Pythium] brassicae (nom. inval.)]
MPTQRPGREPKGAAVPAASKKPVRTRPMRGPGAEDAAASVTGGVALATAPLVQAPLAQAKMKEDFCTQLLLGGYVQAFVDFFYLTHRSEPSSSSSGDDGGGGGGGGLTSTTVFAVAEMEFLRDQLVAAEHCKRKGEVPDVLAAYESLATYCDEKGDLKTMIFFFDKCLEIARLVKDPVCEMRVLRRIGAGYHALGDLESALEHLESHVGIAQIVYAHEDDDELRGDAYRQLGRVYSDLAVQREHVRRFQDAIDAYKKLLDCSSKAGDDATTAHAQFKIGVCYNACAQPSSALPFLESYLTICRKTGNVEGEGSACAELATAHEKLANKQLSIDFLTHYVAIATRADNVASQADACRRLGHIYTASRDFPRARAMHEKNYALLPAAAAGAPAQALNCARVNVGAARANDKLAAFLALVNDDLRGLLEWKNSRALPSTE